MGESVEASINEDKMRKAAPSNPPLEVSVSFGRFENDSLSWEKFSTFSPNKYLEEVEKCATPGSVAKKRAYFEEHYKRIAARKAEILSQEKLMESKSFKSEDRDQDGGDLTGESNVQCSVEERQENNLTSEVNDIFDDEQNEEAGTTIECQGLSAEAVIEEKSGGLESPKPYDPEEAVFLKEEEAPSESSQDKKELAQNLEKEKDDTPKIKEKNVKLGYQSKSHKITSPVKRGRKVEEVWKKPASSGNKTPQFHTPRTSKPTSTPSTVPSSRTSTRGTVSSLTRTKNHPVGENKKVAPKSLHMSLSLEPSSSNPPPLATNRKSLIMERMGDKDIVKRAFKTFQSNYSQLKSSSQEQSATPKQVVARAKWTEPKVSPSMTPQRENGRSNRASGMERKNAKAAPSAFGFKSDERAEKRKEFLKKLEEKSNAREAERTRLQTKSKEDRETEIKKLRQSLNFKAIPLPGFYRGQNLSKSHIDKDTKNHKHQ